jgi:hypothetical protein
MTASRNHKEANMPMSALGSLRLAEKRAEHSFHIARAKVLEAEIADATASVAAADEDTFRPEWKLGARPHLSDEGKAAIINAYRRGMRPADVARLFRISEKAALDWQERARKILAAGKAADALRAAAN